MGRNNSLNICIISVNLIMSNFIEVTFGFSIDIIFQDIIYGDRPGLFVLVDIIAPYDFTVHKPHPFDTCAYVY